MRIKQKCFSLPNCIFEDDLPGEAFRLLSFLFSVSDFSGACAPGVVQMKRVTGIVSEHTIADSLKLLNARGWIFARRKGGCNPDTFWIQIPPRYRSTRRKAKPLIQSIEL